MVATIHSRHAPAKPAVPHRILLIENDAPTRAAMAFVLESAGYEVVKAADGPAGLAFLLRSRELPRLILLDVREAWGFRVEQKKHADSADVPVVVFSSTGCPEAETYSLDAVAYLPHPFGHRDLLGIVQRQVAP